MHNNISSTTGEMRIHSTERITLIRSTLLQVAYLRFSLSHKRTFLSPTEKVIYSENSETGWKKTTQSYSMPKYYREVYTSIPADTSGTKIVLVWPSPAFDEKYTRTHFVAWSTFVITLSSTLLFQSKTKFYSPHFRPLCSFLPSDCRLNTVYRLQFKVQKL